MIRLRYLSDDFYSFDGDTMTVTGSATGNEYRLGDEVRIRMKEVSVEKRYKVRDGATRSASGM